MLRNIAPADRMTVESILKEHGIKMIDEVTLTLTLTLTLTITLPLHHHPPPSPSPLTAHRSPLTFHPYQAEATLEARSLAVAQKD